MGFLSLLIMIIKLRGKYEFQKEPTKKLDGKTYSQRCCELIKYLCNQNTGIFMIFEKSRSKERLQK